MALEGAGVAYAAAYPSSVAEDEVEVDTAGSLSRAGATLLDKPDGTYGYTAMLWSAWMQCPQGRSRTCRHLDGWDRLGWMA